MAKCIKNLSNGIISRVSNVEAFKRVNTGDYAYDSKENYRKQQEGKDAN